MVPNTPPVRLCSSLCLCLSLFLSCFRDHPQLPCLKRHLCRLLLQLANFRFDQGQFAQLAAIFRHPLLDTSKSLEERFGPVPEQPVLPCIDDPSVLDMVFQLKPLVLRARANMAVHCNETALQLLEEALDRMNRVQLEVCAA